MLEFLQRLKQRKLVQWAIAYVAFAFALIQVIDVVADSYEWPRLVMHLIFGVLTLGFVVMLVLAWYHGERGGQRISGPELLLIALALAIGGGLLWHFGRSGSAPAARIATTEPAGVNTVAMRSPDGAQPRSPDEAQRNPGKAAPDFAAVAAASGLRGEVAARSIPAKSIAVLPFKSLSTDEGNAYFAAGIQDLILTKLADIGDLKVISRTSTERFASHPDDLKTIARQLGTATILEGSVQKSGRVVLVNVQLIDGLSDNQLWAESYQRTLDDVFGVEGEVAQRVAAALKTRLDADEVARIAAIPTANPEAYDLFLRAVSLLDRGNDNLDLQAVRQSFPLFARALGSDPAFALAAARWSYAESLVAFFGQGSDAAALKTSARRHAQQALSLQPGLAAAQLAMGFSDHWGRQDYEGSRKWFDAILEVRPHFTEAIVARALVLRRTGHTGEAMRELQAALALDPSNPLIIADVSETAAMMRRYGDAERMFRLALAQDTRSGWARLLFARSIVCAGGSLVLATRVVQGDEPVMRVQRAWLLTLQQKYDAAIALLDGVPDKPENFGLFFDPKELQLARLYRYAGDAGRARAQYGRALPQLRAHAGALRGNALLSGLLLSYVAEAEQGAGDTRAAMATAQDALARVLRADDHVNGPIAAMHIAAVYAQAERADLALPMLEREIAAPDGGLRMSPALLRIDPAWKPIRNDPRFQALLKRYPTATASTSAVVPAPPSSI
ncbi:MAG: hypothetical protein ACREPZ_11870 [Rhodanobacteraceae bacterium]